MSVRAFGFGTKLQSVVLCGGIPWEYQLREMEQGCDVIIGTPGRLIYMLEKQQVGESWIDGIMLG